MALVIIYGVITPVPIFISTVITMIIKFLVSPTKSGKIVAIDSSKEGFLFCVWDN
jgi:hypothetical protein